MNANESLMDKILQHFAGPTFKDELEMAKKEFFGTQNLLEEHSDRFEQRMTQFFDWYFFTRELSGYGRTPLEVCDQERALRFSPEEAATLSALRSHRHSLFEFQKLKGEDVYLKDLLKNEKIIVQKSPWIYGFDGKEIFEARLVPDEKAWVFTRGFCFHPETATKFIQDEIKRHRKNPDLDPDELMLKLAKMRSKCEQYKHVRPEMIYSHESKLTS
ncbi:MAG: hypothetical protein KF789_04980 [Bdellovibrionaceae bacterium]|nr:hypothetical protein [Pseudobdellovibrionaceae bacterium]